RAGVRVRGHGAGMGVALVTGDLESAAELLAEDVVAFDQRGCLSPRVAFVAADAQAFARALRDALDARAKVVPRGRLDQAELSDLALWASTVGYAGTLLSGDSCAVGVLEQLSLPPTGRHVLVVPIASPRELPARLAPAARFVVTIGSDAEPELVRQLAPSHARVARLGEMQRPPLDGPVDRR
ncbi:MAG TPA: acyl-CoA reductase, partial [Polyangiaceae bacterium]|nr:acyl-CoA reductase [Polyangiaceae bacterium]